MYLAGQLGYYAAFLISYIASICYNITTVRSFCNDNYGDNMLQYGCIRNVLQGLSFRRLSYLVSAYMRVIRFISFDDIGY